MKQTRRSIEVHGLDHGDVPIPYGCRVGNVIFSSGISGRDAGSGVMPESAEAQAANMFRNLRSFLQAAGTDVGRVGHVRVFLKDRKYRGAVDAEWIQCFPDAVSRPARHALVQDLANGMLVQIEVVAVPED